MSIPTLTEAIPQVRGLKSKENCFQKIANVLTEAIPQVRGLKWKKNQS